MSRDTLPTLGEVLNNLVLRLEKKRELPELEAQLLLARLFERSRTWVLAHPEEYLQETQRTQLEEMVRGLEQGEPLPYILGRWEFYSLEFEVTPEVLIPRPETELLVEHALAWLRQKDSVKQKLQILDVGTGSGCIAISLAVNHPGLSITATDQSDAALVVANRNAEKMRVSDQIHFIQADLFPMDMTPHSFHLIAANPPYIPRGELQHLPVLSREPTLALDGGESGMETIHRLLAGATEWLIPGGALMMEMGSSQGVEVEALAKSKFPISQIFIHKDLGGLDRLLEVQS